MFIHYEDASMGSRDEEAEQWPLTTADVRALLDEQDARHKEEIHALLREQEERVNAAHQEIRLLEEATDRRFKDLEQASSSPLQDSANNTFTEGRRSSITQLTPNGPRWRSSPRLSLLLFHKRNEEGSDDNEGDDSKGLEEDTFSIMMLNKPFREIPYCHPALAKVISLVGWLGAIILFADTYSKMDTRIDAFYFRKPVLYWSLLGTFWVMSLGPLSSPWQLSMFTFLFLQLLLGLLIVADQTLMQSWALGCHNGAVCFTFPIGTSVGITFSQYLTVFFALATQSDIFTSLQTLSKLRNANNVPWDEVIGQKGNRTWRLWIFRILLPNVLKFVQAVVILCATFYVIIQSTTLVDLLKDFSALLVVSEADNIMFHIANLGYLGEDLVKKTEEVKAARWMSMEEEREEGQDADEDEEEKLHSHWCNCSMGSFVFFTLWMVMTGALTYVVVGQYNGRYMKMKYPECNVLYRRYWIGDQMCHDIPPYNTAECGWDGGDCPEPRDVDGYINCTVSYPNKIGNGVCYDSPPYNTEECMFDGMDCIYDQVVDGYPDCLVAYPQYIGDGLCLNWAPYNTPECGYDGGDCDPPQ